MLKFIKHKANNIGLPPGTLLQKEKIFEKVKIDVVRYNLENYSEEEVSSIEECIDFSDDKVTWIEIDGIHDIEMIKRLSDPPFKIHFLTLEDIANCGQRVKLEEYDEYLFIVLNIFNFDDGRILNDQFSMIISKNYIISFQEKETGILNPIYQRLKRKSGKIRNMKADYLAYAIIDTVVDNYFIVLNRFREKIEDIEEAIFDEFKNVKIQEIYELKRELILLRKSLEPLKDLINTILKGDVDHITDDTIIYYKDVYDHVIRVIDTLEIFRDMLTANYEMYLSSLNYRTSEIMKFLTRMATIFIPLTFIAGIYGMNFQNMPETKWEFGYIMFWIIIVLSAGTIVYYFKRKKWW
ncbi:MAG: magnesium/cobalt transporter CorA [Spirochaetota bacterium]|nr:magnesium/cobalt transporter CorA [Spirochaetota bacterium]